MEMKKSQPGSLLFYVHVCVCICMYGSRGSSAQSLPCHTASGDNCVCPNTVKSYTCTITNGTPAGYTDWILPNGTCYRLNFTDLIRLSQFVSGLCLNLTPSTCGPYKASSILSSSDPTYCLSSILSVNITSAMNGSTLTCFNTNDLNDSSTSLVLSISIRVIGPPCVTSAIATTIGPDMVQVVVNPSSSCGLPTSYNVTISNSSYVYTITTPAFPNGSAIITFIGLTNSSNYTISSVAINCAGSSNPSTTVYSPWPASTPLSMPTSTATSITSPPSNVTTVTTPTEANNLGVIIGPVVGGVVFIIVLVATIILLLYCLCLRSSKKRREVEVTEEGNNNKGQSEFVFQQNVRRNQQPSVDVTRNQEKSNDSIEFSKIQQGNKQFLYDREKSGLKPFT